MRANFHLRSFTIAKFLLAIIFFLLIANLMVIYLSLVKGYKHLKGFVHGFYFDAEANFPSLYSAMAIMFAAFLLWHIGNLNTERKEQRSFNWKFLSIVFAFLAADEFASIHEGLIQPAQKALFALNVTSDYFYFAWLVPYLIICAIMGLTLVKFFLRLGRHTLLLFFYAGVIYLSGAVVMEMIGGNYWAEKGWAVDGSSTVNVQYAMIVTLEEFLEMVGIVVFIYALTSYYFRNVGSLEFVFKISDSKDYTNYENPGIPRVRRQFWKKASFPTRR